LSPLSNRVEILFLALHLGFRQALFVSERFLQAPQRLIHCFRGIAIFRDQRENLGADVARGQVTTVTFKDIFGALKELVDDGGVVTRHAFWGARKGTIHAPSLPALEEKPVRTTG
jgi:hypothetical protein